MTCEKNVLIAVMNNQKDFETARDKNWYRIPVSSAKKWIKDNWPPLWIAFYHTKAIQNEPYQIKYFAAVREIRELRRWQLFPKELHNEKTNVWYYQIFISPLIQLTTPIISHRWRRITFISTTWDKLIRAAEVNELYCESSLEEKLWFELKKNEIQSERQEFIKGRNKFYALDFAIYCNSGKINIETDGDRWHANPIKAKIDNKRDNDLITNGWRVLRFSSSQIKEEMASYCIKTIKDNIDELDGIETDYRILS